MFGIEEGDVEIGGNGYVASTAIGQSSESNFVRYALDCAAIVAITDVQGNITFANRKFCEISGYSEDELIGQNHRMLRSGLHDKQFFRAMYREIANGRVWHGEICNRRKDGTFYWVDTTIVPHRNTLGKVDGYTSIRFDITARKNAEDRLRQIASEDDLTGMANRRKFQERLNHALEAGGGSSRVHLALLDIDHFKEVNDAFGHDVGDDLLRQVSKRLELLISPKVFIARLGGDEFGIIMSDMSVDEALDLLDSAQEGLRVPMWLGPSRRRCSASIGLASFPEDGSTPDQLFKAADMALYRAKNLGRDRVKQFVPKLRETALRKADMQHAMERGIETEQLELHYQPVVPLAKGAPYALEALLRWRHPQHGLLTPGAFLDDLQDHPGLMSAVGLFVIERAFRDMREMIDKGIPISHIALNVTNADFRSSCFVDRFLELSKRYDVEPCRFCIEVTEGVFLGRDYQHVGRLLRVLHEAGVMIALDDFGTGFASLTHLRDMPVDKIKIDRSFVANMVEKAADAAIVRGIIDIAHSTGKKIVAEGVETLAQAAILEKLGCDYFQGWYFAKAATFGDLPKVIETMPRL